MTADSLLSLSRENVTQVYMDLALQMPGTHALRRPEFVGCVSLSPYSFCNFAIGLRAENPNQIGSAVHHLVELAKSRPLFRVITMSGDQPRDWRDKLAEAGFRPAHHLVKMAWTGSGSLVIPSDIHVEETGQGRALIANFMVGQFFSMYERHFRAAVAKATRSAGHTLVARWLSDRPISAMMLAETERAIGLYNLSVAASHRRKGIGAKMVSFAKCRAAHAKKTLVLQCDNSLTPWYRAQGFEIVGEMQSFHYHC